MRIKLILNITLYVCKFLIETLTVEFEVSLHEFVVGLLVGCFGVQVVKRELDKGFLFADSHPVAVGLAVVVVEEVV